MLYIVALCLHLTLLVILYFWSPSEQTFHILFIVAIVWGIGDGMILNQSTISNYFCQWQGSATLLHLDACFMIV